MRLPTVLNWHRIGNNGGLEMSFWFRKRKELLASLKITSFPRKTCITESVILLVCFGLQAYQIPYAYL